MHCPHVLLLDVECPPVQTWAGALPNSTLRHYGAIINVSCIEVTEDNSTIINATSIHVCQKDATWSPPIVNCEGIKCDDKSLK